MTPPNGRKIFRLAPGAASQHDGLPFGAAYELAIGQDLFHRVLVAET
jgi:hypothetical protein